MVALRRPRKSSARRYMPIMPLNSFCLRPRMPLATAQSSLARCAALVSPLDLPSIFEICASMSSCAEMMIPDTTIAPSGSLSINENALLEPSLVSTSPVMQATCGGFLILCILKKRCGFPSNTQHLCFKLERGASKKKPSEKSSPIGKSSLCS